MASEKKVDAGVEKRDSFALDSGMIGKSLMADPASLGLAGFAFTTFLLSFINAGLLPASSAGIVMALAFSYGGFAQLLTGAFEMRRGNTFGFTAFTSYGSFWFFYAFLIAFSSLKIITLPGKALGIALILWGIFTLYMWINAIRLNLALNMVFLFLWLAFVVLGIGSYYAMTDVTRIGGILGFITAFFAAYTSFAVVSNSIKEHSMPLGPAFMNK